MRGGVDDPKVEPAMTMLGFDDDRAGVIFEIRTSVD